MKKFKIICNNCKSENIKIYEYEQYDGAEEYCGSHYIIYCRDCNNEEYIENIYNEDVK